MNPAAAAVQRHPHLGEPQPVGRLRIDLHTHTMWSGDSTTTPEEYAAAVSAAGLDVVCVTDHNTIAGAGALRDRVGSAVIVGEEVRTATGELIGLFLTERVPMGMSAADTAPSDPRPGWRGVCPASLRPDATVSHRTVAVRPGGGGSARRRRGAERQDLARQPQSPSRGVRHPVRSRSGRGVRRSRARRARCGVRRGRRPGRGAVRSHDGRSARSTRPRLAPRPRCAAVSVHGHHWDEPRPWTPRVIPSV